MFTWKKILFLAVLLLPALSCESQSGQGSAAAARKKPTEVKAKATADAPANLGSDGVVDIEEVDGRFEKRKLAEATFAGGCFWCTEAVFERVKGVVAVYSGYSGGSERNPTYEQVGSGATDHAEAIRIYYDSTVVDYPTMLKVFFASHDPTQLNRQGPDVGAQYRSAVFYQNKREKELTEQYIKKLNESGKFGKLIVTEVSPLRSFYKAEAYHQAYYEQEYPPHTSYVNGVTRPKVEKFIREYPELLKKEFQP